MSTEPDRLDLGYAYSECGWCFELLYEGRSIGTEGLLAIGKAHAACCPVGPPEPPKPWCRRIF